MNPISKEELSTYLKPLTDKQHASVTAIRALLLAHGSNLTEEIDEGKWFNGLLTYRLPSGQFAFALGPRSNGYSTFHMMPFYASKELQERHSPALKKFLSGKSCIKFKNYADLPEASLIDIIKSCSLVLEITQHFKQSSDI